MNEPRGEASRDGSEHSDFSAYMSSSAFVELVSMKAAKIASDELVRREERRAKRTALIFSILALAGVSGSIGVISVQMRSILERSLDDAISRLDPVIEGKVQQSVDGSIGQVRTTLLENEKFDDFIELARTIQEQDDGFSNAQRDAALQRIRELSGVERITAQQRFLEAVRDVVAAFSSAGLSDQINELDTIAGDYMKNDTLATLYLSDHYGEQIVGSAYPVDRQVDSVDRLSKYLAAASSSGYPEKALLWELLIEFKRGGFAASDVTGKLVESIIDLNETDARQLYRFLWMYSDADRWQRVPTQEGRELERILALLVNAHPSLLEGINAHDFTSEEGTRALLVR